MSSNTINFCFRTSFAGCDVAPKALKLSEKICKKYKSFRAVAGGDKAVFCEMDFAEFKRMQDEHADAHIDYLIEIEGVDYSN